MTLATEQNDFDRQRTPTFCVAYFLIIVGFVLNVPSFLFVVELENI